MILDGFSEAGVAAGAKALRDGALLGLPTEQDLAMAMQPADTLQQHIDRREVGDQ